MLKKTAWLAAFTAALLIGACASQKEPATKAVAGVEAALAAVQDEANKYVPDQVAGVNDTITKLKDSLAKGEYAKVLQAAPAATSAIDGLKNAIAAKKAELEATWTDYSSNLPMMVDAIKSRVDILSQSRRLPANISKESFDTAKAGLEMINSKWADASAAAGSGDFTAAIDGAKAVKAKGEEVMSLLGLSSAG
ncbi:MAG: hypothetical protein R3E77_00085 [Steroidobacteraceae bacterium]